jgi:hypothetical protein
MKTKAVCLVFAIALASGAVAYGALGHADRVGATWAYTELGPPVRLSGHVKELYPGIRRHIRVEVRNRSRHPVKLRSVGVRVRPASPGCSAGNLVAGRYHGSRKVPAHHTKRVGLPIAMRTRAPDACQGARFGLLFKARVAR